MHYTGRCIKVRPYLLDQLAFFVKQTGFYPYYVLDTKVYAQSSNDQQMNRIEPVIQHFILFSTLTIVDKGKAKA